MVCCNQFNEGKEILYPREQIIEEYYQKALEDGIDPSQFRIIEKGNDIKDAQLLTVFHRFLHFVRDRDLLFEHGILILANREGKVLELAHPSDFPDFFQKGDSECFDWSLEAIGPNAIGLTAKKGISTFVNGSEHYHHLLKNYQSTSVPISDSSKQMIGILGFLSTRNYKAQALGCLQGILVAFELAYLEHEKFVVLEREAKKRDALFDMTQKLYSTMDVNEILSEAIHTFQLFYPEVQIELWLTQEYLVSNLPIKQLMFIPNREDINGQAFLEGKLILRRRKQNEKNGEIAAPLRGKQGVYGVIHISYDQIDTFTEEEISFISNIADIIGMAFEKAKLYQQSNHLVKELRAINELTKRLNQSLTLDTILQIVISELTKLYDAQHVSVLKVSEKKDCLTVIASNINSNVGMIVSLDSGYMGHVYQNKEPIIVSDIQANQQIVDPYMQGLGCRSLMSVPILSNDEMIGVLSVSNSKPLHFSYDDFKMLQHFAQHLGLVLTNAFLHEKLQKVAITDYLTGLYNRSFLDSKMQESQKNDELGSLILFDIDDFKKINDTFGHQIGDQILIQFANILEGSIRSTDIASRWGGEEIALYLPQIDTDIALQIGKRILKRVGQETSPKITASAGIATWKQGDKDLSVISLVRHADQALYAAKHKGKNQVIVYPA
ncbi:sensor domain-containing diguanylate cyclase [Tepidibacillus fermentans]|uniref:Diguanylate cyclase (GGDEF)-like protein n=1 Tax=Tepidibacillus fermentans TaxID=1281767 RepID=A0A4V2USG0_9BACI|nr:sensor domain-containing diguanylate cyclase [Tepidibacillus fermentans]TCS81292.1 diguanylate cyclase (GGDEF)-like protein [Tepidibacillus fermentans]